MNLIAAALKDGKRGYTRTAGLSSSPLRSYHARGAEFCAADTIKGTEPRNSLRHNADLQPRWPTLSRITCLNLVKTVRIIVSI